MRNSYYDQGITAALTELRLQKTAAPVSGFRKIIPQITQRLGEISPYVSEKFYSAVPGARPYLAGAGRQALNEALIGTAFGGVLGGVFGGIGAEPGHRTEGMLHGAASGLLPGAVWGGISGFARKPIQNFSKLQLQAIAKERGHSAQAAARLAEKEYDQRNWFGNVKDLVTGKGALGRHGSAIATGGGLLGFGLADTYLPNVIMPMNEDTPPPPPTSSRVVTAAEKKHKVKKLKEPEPTIPPSMLGSYVGGLGTNISVRALKHHKRIPFQRKLSPFMLETIPILATTAGAATGFVTAKKIKQHQDQKSTASKK